MVRKKQQSAIHKGGKKNRKFGRNKIKCARYRSDHRKEKSHIRRIRRHIARYHDQSSIAREALERYLKLI